MSKKKWTYEACYEAALTCKTKSELKKKYKGAYVTALENDLFKNYTWFINGYSENNKKRRKWTREACYKLALECNSKIELQNKNKSAYESARENGWDKDYTWFQRPSKATWTYERCREVALKCKTIKELYKQFPGAYSASNRNRWLNRFDWLQRKENVYETTPDNVYAYFFSETKTVYIGRTVQPYERNLKHNTDERSSVYKYAHKNCVPVPKMTILESGLTLTEGLEKEDYYVNKYRKDGWNVLNQAKTGVRSGALGTINKGKWNKKTCCKEAKKYNNKTDFKNNSGRAYEISRRNGWLDEWFPKKKTA